MACVYRSTCDEWALAKSSRRAQRLLEPRAWDFRCVPHRNVGGRERWVLVPCGPSFHAGTRNHDIDRASLSPAIKSRGHPGRHDRSAWNRLRSGFSVFNGGNSASIEHLGLAHADRHHFGDGARSHGDGKSNELGVVSRRHIWNSRCVRRATDRDLGTRHVRRLKSHA
jgi:hypothetical protein